MTKGSKDTAELSACWIGGYEHEFNRTAFFETKGLYAGGNFISGGFGTAMKKREEAGHPACASDWKKYCFDL